MNFAKSPERVEESSRLFSPKSRQTGDILDSKLMSYLSGASAIKTQKQDYSEFNNSTGTSGITMANTRILSPTSRDRPNNSVLRSPNIGNGIEKGIGRR